MRLLGNLLVWISLAIGLLAATSFYAWEVGPDAASDARFRLGSHPDGSPRYAELLRDVKTTDGNVIADAGSPLDPDRLNFIRQAGIRRVNVKHPGSAFDVMLANWSGKWMFLVSVVGLTAGAMLLRADAKKQVSKAHLSETPVSSPEEVVARMRQAIADLRASLEGMAGDDERMDAIVRTLGEVQAELVPAFVETRSVLIARGGVGGFARVMDLFAGAERKINRSWSAAADGAAAESVASLEDAASAMDQLAEALQG
ncbi:MAG: hypothetical protein Kow0022_04650 [Phycisphaerales bacterium]